MFKSRRHFIVASVLSLALTTVFVPLEVSAADGDLARAATANYPGLTIDGRGLDDIAVPAKAVERSAEAQMTQSTSHPVGGETALLGLCAVGPLGLIQRRMLNR